jgi:hypothetical protein
VRQRRPGSCRAWSTARSSLTGSPRFATPSRLAAASGLRNLVAHRYGVIDWRRIHEIASTHLDDLLEFCETLARRAQE